MAWPFRCSSPDFAARSIPDDTTFAVKRSCLVDGSELFGNMFADCDAQEQAVDLPETAPALAVLFRLLHDPPLPYVHLHVEPGLPAPVAPPGHITDPEEAIPFPVLSLALEVADKYMLRPELVETLHTHLAAHVATEPLKVYGLALSLGLQRIANSASEFLLHPPLASYTLAEIGAIPTVRDLHQLVRLHGAREAKLRELLQGEAIFPHDYGLCYTHGPATVRIWEEHKRLLLHKTRAGTDVAAEMSLVSEDLGSCRICLKACTAAVDMLAYKCRRAIRRVDHLPPE